MPQSKSIREINLSSADNQRLALLCGEFDKNLRLIERSLGVEINNRGAQFEIIGMPLSVEKAEEVLHNLYEQTHHNKSLSTQEIQLLLKSMNVDYEFHNQQSQLKLQETSLKLEEATVKPRTPNQRHYITAINRYDINFGIGPSGTGKTFLAVACALMALNQRQVNRIILVRPAVEAGENLGFLPGDLAQKIDPYLRPLYDALYEMQGAEKISQLISKGIIEVAPLAYMRGRTLNEAFVILDEGQNTSKEQMKMFLTRIGFSSKAVITGDITQIDLPHKTESGLRHAISLLHDIEAIHFTFFKSEDVVRHPLVQQIIEAYEQESQT